MKFSSIVPSQGLQDESGLRALDFEVAVSAVSNSKSEKQKPYLKWSGQKSFTIGKYATAAKKVCIKEPTSLESTVRGFCAMYKGELEKARKEKRPTAPNLNVLLTEPPFLLGSLDQMFQKFLLAL